MYVVELLVWMHVLNRCGASSRASLTTPRVTSFKSLEKVLLLPVGVVEGGGLVIWDRYLAVSQTVFIALVSQTVFIALVFVLR